MIGSPNPQHYVAGGSTEAQSDEQRSFDHGVDVGIEAGALRERRRIRRAIKRARMLVELGRSRGSGPATCDEIAAILDAATRRPRKRP